MAQEKPRRGRPPIGDKAKDRAPGRHKSGSKLVRIPHPHGALIEQIAALEDRSVGMVIVRALRDYYAKQGYKFPPANPDDPQIEKVSG